MGSPSVRATSASRMRQPPPALGAHRAWTTSARRSDELGLEDVMRSDPSVGHELEAAERMGEQPLDEIRRA